MSLKFSSMFQGAKAEPIKESKLDLPINLALNKFEAIETTPNAQQLRLIDKL
jgi:hypothetical protein